MRSSRYTSSGRKLAPIVPIVLAVLLVAAALSPVGVFAAPGARMVQQDSEPEEDGTVAAFCNADIDYVHTTEGFQHPVGAGLYQRFGAEYEVVMAWFCEDHLGFGQIMLALATADLADGGGREDADALLARRRTGEGWGQIWQDLGRIGPGMRTAPGSGEEDAGETADTHYGLERTGPPDHAGPHQARPPAHAGSKSGEERDAASPGGPPPHAGRPDHAGGPNTNRNRP